MIGFLGRRLDHLVTNLLVLAKLVKNGVKVRIIEGNQTIWSIKDKGRNPEGWLWERSEQRHDKITGQNRTQRGFIDGGAANLLI